MAMKKPSRKARARPDPTRKVAAPRKAAVAKVEPYTAVLRRMAHLIEGARHASARAVNVLMTATYWEIGRRIVEHEQGGSRRAGYGDELIERLSTDLGERFGRGFSQRNLEQMRAFYLRWPIPQTLSAELRAGHQAYPSEGGRTRKAQTPSAELKAARSRSKVQTVSAISSGKEQKRAGTANDIAALHVLSERFPLPWSHYVRLLTVENEKARAFYEAEALRNGWSVRQLDRQVSTRFYERVGASRNKEHMLLSGATKERGDAQDMIREPFLLEFLGLKDEYSESDLEEALITHLEHFLLELGSDFAFVGRQRRLRVGRRWYRIDLLFFHRRLRCLVVIDLKVGGFTHADAGQMNLYLNYAHEHWTQEGENPPVGLILCTEHDDAVAHYTLNNIGNNMMAREYRLALPKEKKLEEAIEKARKRIERLSRS
jgi:predicted nuclease of restriction endonuclease-like (RecB) superfamily